MKSNQLPSELASDLMPALSAIVARASAEILRLSYGGQREKPDGSPVTDADEAAEAVILDGLDALLPGIPVVAEERLGRESAPSVGGSFVLVDPLDGTREFVSGSDEYTVNIGLIADRRPIAGIVSAPARGLLWRGIIGRGAERLRMQANSIGAPEPIGGRIWPKTGAVALVSRSHLDAGTTAFLGRLPPTIPESCGSSLKFCRLAEGTADIYPRLGPTSEWDIAAGHALLVAAGGRVTAPDGSDLLYGRSSDNFRVPGFIAWSDATKRS